MYHLFMHATPARILGVGPETQIHIAELAPHAYHFDSFCFIRFGEKAIPHRVTSEGLAGHCTEICLGPAAPNWSVLFCHRHIRTGSVTLPAEGVERHA